MKYYLEQVKDRLAAEVAGILDIPIEKIAVQVANEKIGSDLAIPCFVFAKELSRSPQAIAEQVVEGLNFKDAREVKAIAGYINVWLSSASLAAGVGKDFATAKPGQYGNNGDRAGEVVVTEYTDPNPFKPLHIGHAYSNTVGESISRLFEASGAEVHRISYHGDVGLHVAMALWGIFKELEARDWKMSDVPEGYRTELLGKSYVHGRSAYEDNEDAKKEINELNKQIYDKSDPDINGVYDIGRRWSFEAFDHLYKMLGVGFEHNYLENETVDIARKVIDEGLAKGVFEHSNGAIIFKGEEYGLHTRVFINSMGIPTYEAKDIGLAHLKHADYQYNTSVILTGNEQDQYFEVVLKALSLLRPDLADATVHMSHGMVRLPSGKMSSRSGNAIGAEKLILDIREALKAGSPDSPSINANALAAIKYAFLSHSIGSDIIFDINQSISLEGNSGPYVQYAAVRVGSILAKAGEVGEPSQDYDYAAEQELLFMMAAYPGVVAEAINQLAPHIITNFSFDLAKAWNRYYEKVQILSGDGEGIKSARLNMLKQVYDVFGHSLGLLGITIPEKM